MYSAYMMFIVFVLFPPICESISISSFGPVHFMLYLLQIFLFLIFALMRVQEQKQSDGLFGKRIEHKGKSRGKLTCYKYSIFKDLRTFCR